MSKPRLLDRCAWHHSCHAEGAGRQASRRDVRALPRRAQPRPGSQEIRCNAADGVHPFQNARMADARQGVSAEGRVSGRLLHTRPRWLLPQDARRSQVVAPCRLGGSERTDPARTPHPPSRRRQGEQRSGESPMRHANRPLALPPSSSVVRAWDLSVVWDALGSQAPTLGATRNASGSQASALLRTAVRR